MVLGIAGTISPIPFLQENIIDIVILLVFSLLVWIFAWTKQRLERAEGATMLILYAIYVVYICMR
jgi:cation:H+ antiporter